MNQFYSKDNLKELMRTSRGYIQETYDIDIAKLEESSTTKKLIFDEMTDVKNENKNASISLDELNIAVLRRVTASYAKKYSLKRINQKFKQTQALRRDQSVYGQRPIPTNLPIPERDSYKKQETDNSFDRFISERNAEFAPKQPNLDISQLGPSIDEQVDTSDDFAKKIKELELERLKIQQDLDKRKPEIIKQRELMGLDNSNIVLNRMEIEKQKNIKNDIANANVFSLHTIEPLSKTAGKVPPQFGNERQDLVIDRKTTKQMLVKKYIDINSGDRNWPNDPYRYKYGVSFLTNNNDIQSRYRNIASLEIGEVIVPEDRVIGLFNSNDTTEPFRPYNYEFTLNIPFVYLIIKEFDDVYDGTNQYARRAFCKLTIDRSFQTTDNGRTFTVLKPSLREKKVFYPAPLGSLTKLSFEFVRPNGKLINTSIDTYAIQSVSYNNSTFPFYLAITFSEYFDVNEFNIYDIVIIKNYEMTQLTNAQDPGDVAGFNEFINDPSGHSIVSLGSANGNGFYNTIYIMAQNTFDANNGALDVDENYITVLEAYNSEFPGPSGVLLNYSMQNSITMTIETLVDDATFISK